MRYKMIDIDYYKIIASNESEMSEKAFEFRNTLRDLIADIEREQGLSAGNAGYSEIAGNDLDTELDAEFRMAISHMMLGYECDMSKEDFNTLINECAKITKKFMRREHKCEGCNTIIYYKSYCDNCQRLWES